jgi:hypothetical protein
MINPKVSEIADVTILKQELVLIQPINEINPSNLQWFGPDPTAGQYVIPWYYNTMIWGDPLLKLGDRFTIKVTPKDGSPASTIIKTFELNYIRNDIYHGKNY